MPLRTSLCDYVRRLVGRRLIVIDTLDLESTLHKQRDNLIE